MWVVAGLLATCGALCYAELSAAIPQTGGTYVFLKRAYRLPIIAFLFSFSILFREGVEAVLLIAILLGSLAAGSAANYKKPAVAAQTEPEYYEKLNTTNLQFLVAIVIMVSIMAIGSVFGAPTSVFCRPAATPMPRSSASGFIGGMLMRCRPSQPVTRFASTGLPTSM